MGRYIVPGSVIALSTAFKTGLQAYATSGATRRGFLMGIDISQIGAPSGTDCQIQYDIPRITVGSTSMTTYTPNDVSGGADAAAAMTAGIGSTGSTEPTVMANSQLFNRGINQRNSFRWDANDRLAALIFPASAGAGIAGRAQCTVAAAFAGTGLQTFTFEE